MKVHSLSKKLIILTLIITGIVMSFNISFAYWWGTPSYEWALQNGLTGTKTRAQLDSTVELDDLYSTVLTYLSQKGIYPLDKKIHHEDKMDGMDNVAKGIVDIINGFLDKKELTIQQYYVVENYTEKGYDTLETYKAYSQRLTREDLKNLEAYLRLSRYRAATLIKDRSDREFALERLGYVKNSKIVNYGVIPYSSKISRQEFLAMMYDLLSPTASGSSIDYVIDTFYETEVLIGYDTGLELEKLLSYTEMYAFLYRMESYDFETNSTKTALYGIDKVIDDAFYGNINKQQLTDYLLDLAENTNYQIDLVKRLEDELGEEWTVREAGELLYDIYMDEGFTYTSGRNTITQKGKK